MYSRLLYDLYVYLQLLFLIRVPGVRNMPTRGTHGRVRDDLYVRCQLHLLLRQRQGAEVRRPAPSLPAR